MPVHVSSTVVLIIRSSKIVLFVFIICIIIINCIIQRLVSSHSVGGRPVRRLREDCAPDGHLQRVMIPNAV